MVDLASVGPTPIIVGAVSGQPARVVTEAARYAKLLGVGIVVAYVDVTRFVTYEDPDGFVHTAPIDLSLPLAAADLAAVTREVTQNLEGTGISFVVENMVGDPASAMAKLAATVDAQLLVVGTRKRGIGESLREFFTGSVAARLAHRQSVPVLVVPLEDAAPGADRAHTDDLWEG